MDGTARLLAVEVLLADPETLGNDALEGDLYILRECATRRCCSQARWGYRVSGWG